MPTTWRVGLLVGGFPFAILSSSFAVDGCFVCIGRAGGNLVRCRSRGPGDVVAGEGMARMSGTSVRDCPDALVVLSFLLAAGIPNDRFAGFLL